MMVVAPGDAGKARNRVLPVLLELLDDEAVAAYAVMGPGKVKAPEARVGIERFLDHPQAWVRKEAKNALAKRPA